jgi:hypothetical protein
VDVAKRHQTKILRFLQQLIHKQIWVGVRQSSKKRVSNKSTAENQMRAKSNEDLD